MTMLSAISTLTNDVTDTATSLNWSSSVTNIDLSPYLPPELTNIKGALLGIYISAYAAPAKTATGMSVFGGASYAITYNATPDRTMASAEIETSGAATVTQKQYARANALVPVNYSGGVPYVTWQLYEVAAGMAASSGQYRVAANVWLHGVLI